MVEASSESVRAKGRPHVEVLSGSSGTANVQNPYDRAGAGGRWAARVRVLSGRIAQDWNELITTRVAEEVVVDGERLITAREAWERLAVSERAFYRWVKHANISCYRIGRSVRYKWSDIEAAMRPQEVLRKATS